MNCLVTDSAGEYTAASRVSSLAIDVISTFRQSTYFMGQLHTEQESIYRGKYVHLSLPCDTRWNSFFHSYFNLLKTKSALKSLVTKLNPEDTLLLVRLLHPFCAALNKLQRDKARLDHVLYSFGKIVQMIQEIPSEEFKNQMLIQLQNWWNDMNYRRKKTEIDESQKKFHSENYVAPVEESEIQESEISNESFIGDIENVVQWNAVMGRWMEMLNDESTRYHLFQENLAGRSLRNLRTNSDLSLNDPRICHENMCKFKQFLDGIKYSGPIAASTDNTKLSMKQS
ncbi:4049_t:CDS:2 [Entrophospora sp. SA101]|nr:4049_t:CDS:2 [Entrophospora sp. SA101]